MTVDAAFEDGLIRLADLDADGSPQIVLVASRLAGAAVTVLGVERRDGAPVLLERARGPSVGAGRWLNPVGVGDLHGDGQLDVVAVATPHIGGVLTLYCYQRPHLVPVAYERDVSNDVYGEVEQQLAAVTIRDGRLCVAIPNQRRHLLRFLAPTLRGGWESVASDAVFKHPVESVRWVNGDRLQVHAGSRIGCCGDRASARIGEEPLRLHGTSAFVVENRQLPNGSRAIEGAGVDLLCGSRCPGLLACIVRLEGRCSGLSLASGHRRSAFGPSTVF